jgi:ATP-binding cassette, subfamily B, bacterial PglK
MFIREHKPSSDNILSVVFHFIDILDPKSRFYLACIVVLAVIASILEIASLSLLVQVISQNQSSFFYVEKDIELGIKLLLIIFLIKNIYLICFTYFRSKFAWSLKFKLFEYMLDCVSDRSYLNNEYSIKTDLKKMTTDLQILTNRFILSWLAFISEIIILFALIFWILWDVEKIILFSMLIFFTITMTLSFLIKKISEDKGKIREVFEKKRISSINFILYNMTKLNYSGLLNRFKKKLNRESIVTFNAEAVQNAVSQTPRYFLEGCVALIAMVCLGFIQNLESFFDVYLNTMLIIALAFIRILPSLSKILNSYSNIRFSTPIMSNTLSQHSADVLHKQEKESESLRLSFHENKNGKHSIFIGEEKILELDDQLFSTQGMICITGASGAGKSTVLKWLIHSEASKKFQSQNSIRRIAVSDEPWLFSQKEDADDLINYINQSDGKYSKLAKKLLSEMELREADNNNLSFGERIRLSFCLALMSEPEMLILDEPTRGLDVKTEETIIQSLVLLAKTMPVYVASHSTKLTKNAHALFKIDEQQLSKVRK